MNAQGAAVTGPAAWGGSGLVVLGTLVGASTLRPVLETGPWVGVTAVLVLVLALVTAQVRQVTRSRTAPTFWGLAVGLLSLVSVYSGTGTAPGLPVPTPEALDRLVRLARSGVEAIADGRVPVEPVRGIELFVVAGVVLVYLVADLLALGLGRAGLAGLALLGLWLPVILFEREPGPAALALGGIVFVLLLVLTRPRGRAAGTALPRAVGPVLGAAVVVTVAAMVLGPVTAGLPLYGSVRLEGTWGGGVGGGPLRLSTDLDMRSSLSERSGRTLLTYRTDAPTTGPFRMYTMTEFDGREWARGDADGDFSESDGLLWPERTEDVAPDDRVRITVDVGDLDQDRLPVPVEPRTIEAPGIWRYDASRDEVVGVGSTSTRNTSYMIETSPRDLSPDVLRLAGTASPDGLPGPVLDVPQTAFVADIQALADEVTAGAANPYDQALALQSYFRDVTNFRYDTEVPEAQTDDAVWDFLTQRTGYCVQYATAMVVMSRALGIPARMAIGFLPGQPTSTRGEYAISGRQAHAWPELYFEGAGWVRFEPTPAVQTGAPPVYADPFSGQNLTPEEEELGGTAGPATAPSTAPDASGSQGDDSVGIGSATVPVTAVIGGAGVLVLALAAVTVLLIRRRRARPHEPLGTEEWWAELRARLGARGVTWTDATTPRQVAASIRAAYRSAGHDETPEASLRAVDRLVAAVEDVRYGPLPVEPEPDDLASWVDLAERPLVPLAERPLVTEGADALS